MDPEGAAGRQAASPLPARRRQPRPLPVRDLAYAHLSLPALRGYRTALGTEESRVSYCAGSCRRAWMSYGPGRRAPWTAPTCARC